MDITSADFREYIIKHELAHIRNCHSLDSLFLGLGQVIKWFTPVTLFYKKAVTALHEFSADRAVIENSKTIDGYQQKILKYAYINNHVAFTSSLSNTMIKKRFTMMTKQNQGRHTTFRIMASVIAAAFLLLAFSSGDKIGIKTFPDRMNLVPSLAGPDNNAIPVVNPVPDTSLHSAADQTVSGNIQNKEEEEEMRILNEELDRMRDKDHTDSLSRLPHAEFFMDPENTGRHIAEMQREIAERQLRNAERQLRHAEEQQMLAERLRPLIIDCPIPPDPELLRKMAEAQARLGHIRPMTEENFIFPPLVYPFHFDGNYPDLQELNSRIEEQLKNPELRHIIEHESLRSLEEKDLKMLEEQKEWQEKYRREMEKQRDQMEKTRRQLLDEYQQIMKKYRKESGIN